MNKRLTDVTINKKTSPEKLAATQVMLSCKSFKKREWILERQLVIMSILSQVPSIQLQ